jgi:hypothetical protein
MVKNMMYAVRSIATYCTGSTLSWKKDESACNRVLEHNNGIVQNITFVQNIVFWGGIFLLTGEKAEVAGALYSSGPPYLAVSIFSVYRNVDGWILWLFMGSQSGEKKP